MLYVHSLLARVMSREMWLQYVAASNQRAHTCSCLAPVPRYGGHPSYQRGSIWQDSHQGVVGAVWDTHPHPALFHFYVHSEDEDTNGAMPALSCSRLLHKGALFSPFKNSVIKHHCCCVEVSRSIKQFAHTHLTEKSCSHHSSATAPTYQAAPAAPHSRNPQGVACPIEKRTLAV